MTPASTTARVSASGTIRLGSFDSSPSEVPDSKPAQDRKPKTAAVMMALNGTSPGSSTEKSTPVSTGASPEATLPMMTKDRITIATMPTNPIASRVRAVTADSRRFSSRTNSPTTTGTITHARSGTAMPKPTSSPRRTPRRRP